MLFPGIRPATSKKKGGGGGAQADQRLLSSAAAKHWYVMGEAESHLLSTLYHDDLAAYHHGIWMSIPPLRKMSPLSVYKPFSAM